MKDKIFVSEGFITVCSGGKWDYIGCIVIFRVRYIMKGVSIYQYFRKHSLKRQ